MSMFGLGGGFDCYVMESSFLADQIVDAVCSGENVFSAADRLGINLETDLTRYDYDRIFELVE